MTTAREWSRVTDSVNEAPEADVQLVLTPRPRHRSASPRDGTSDDGAGRGCPLRGRRLTTGEPQPGDGLRRRYNSMSASTMPRPTVTMRTTAGSDVPRRLRVSRDATQPATGSMRSLRSSSSQEDCEEADEFPDRSLLGAVGGAALPVYGRPRAATCPESKAFRRRARVLSYNRPPTPTPTPAGTDIESSAPNDGDDDDDDDCGTSQRLADLRLNVAYVREPANGRSGIVVTKSPSLGNCGADLPSISESQ